jgi:hypothetical protein
VRRRDAHSEARSPGSRESLRASVDYDNIGPSEEDRFNLVVQRVRTAGSEHIEDQEIFRRVSCLPGSTRFVATALQESTLVKVRGDVPTTRPDRTFRAGARHPIGYVDSNPDGDDGAPITDYDIIGSADRGTGLFALRGVPDLHFVCVPPLTRDQDVGASVFVVASQLCRDLRTILIVDPRARWATCDDAIRGLRELALQNENAVMCFPRVLAYDRLRARYEVFANCGAVAGALVRMEQTRPWWRPEPDDELLLRPGSRPMRVLSETERQRLAAHGINPIQSLRAANPQPGVLRTLARGAAGSADGNLLTPRRRALLIMSSPRGRHALGHVRAARPAHVVSARAAGSRVPAAARGGAAVRVRPRRGCVLRDLRRAAQHRGGRGRGQRERAGRPPLDAIAGLPVVPDQARHTAAARCGSCDRTGCRPARA